MWCLLFTLAKLSGVFCPRWQKNVVSFVHPGKNSLVSFGSGVFCPTFEGSHRIASYIRDHVCMVYVRPSCRISDHIVASMLFL